MPTAWLPCPGNTNATAIFLPFSRTIRKNTAVSGLSSWPGDSNQATTFLRQCGGGSRAYPMSELVTDEDLARARHDPEFRQRFYADNLDRLLEKLNEMRRTGGDARLIKEGVDLAVKLAERLNTKANLAKNEPGGRAA
jgi:hypothetical protein